MITTFKTTETGTNGGITWLGIIASAIGALAIGLAALPIFPHFKILFITTISGVFGSLVDSFVGATLENKKYIGNFGTNLIATFSGGILGIILFNFW